MSDEVKNIKEAGEAAASPAFINVTLSDRDETVVKVGKLPWMQFGSLYRSVHGLLQGGIKLYLESSRQQDAENEVLRLNAMLSATRADLADKPDDAELKREEAQYVSDLEAAAKALETRGGNLKKMQKELLDAALSIPEVIADLAVGATKHFKEHGDLDEVDFDDVLTVAMAAIKVNFLQNGKVRSFFGDAKLLSGLSGESKQEAESDEED